jgi:FkbM family methyltransferase
MAVLYPEARITGVEMDPENAALCRGNMGPWSDRCEVIQAAVWLGEGEVEYAREPGNELGFRADRPARRAVAAARAPVLTLDALAARGGEGPIDFVKMDIEGAERVVLGRDTGWAARVQAIKVEVHEPYTVNDCRRDLDRLGFTTSVDERHPAAVLGVRRPRGGKGEARDGAEGDAGSP